MNHFLHKAGVAVIAAATLLTAGCTHREERMRRSRVSNFVIDETIKSAEQAYVVTGPDGFRRYALVTAELHWPEKLGDNAITTLQDSIKSLAFGPTANHSHSIDRLITTFVSKPGADDETMSWTAIDSIPDSEAEDIWTIDLYATVTECNKKWVSCMIERDEYTGGAHPDATRTPFTYDLEAARVLTVENMFVPGSTPRLMEAIRESLASQLNVAPDKLEQAGIFTDRLTTPGRLVIEGDNIVIFYDTYEIAPYSMGPVKVELWPASLEDILTPEAKALLL